MLLISEQSPPRLLPSGRLDHRCKAVAAYRAAAESYVQLLGGLDKINAFELQIIRRAATLTVIADRAESKLLSNPDNETNIQGLVKLTRELRRLLMSLGLRREWVRGSRTNMVYRDQDDYEDAEYDEDDDEEQPEEEPSVAAQQIELAQERHSAAVPEAPTNDLNNLDAWQAADKVFSDKSSSAENIPEPPPRPKNEARIADTTPTGYTGLPETPGVVNPQALQSQEQAAAEAAHEAERRQIRHAAAQLQKQIQGMAPCHRREDLVQQLGGLAARWMELEK